MWTIAAPRGGWPPPWPQLVEIVQAIPHTQWTLVGGLDGATARRLRGAGAHQADAGRGHDPAHRDRRCHFQRCPRRAGTARVRAAPANGRRPGASVCPWAPRRGDGRCHGGRPAPSEMAPEGAAANRVRSPRWHLSAAQDGELRSGHRRDHCDAQRPRCARCTGAQGRGLHRGHTRPRPPPR